MSSPNLGPSIPTQHAANLLARERQRGIPFGLTESAYPDVFSPLSAAERRAARGYAADAATFGRAVQRGEEDEPFAAYPAEERPAGGLGLFDVTVRFGEPDAEGQYGDYRTVLIAYDPAQTRASLAQTAREEVYGQSDPPDLEISPDIEIRFIPFDLHG